MLRNFIKLKEGEASAYPLSLRILAAFCAAFSRKSAQSIVYQHVTKTAQ